MRPFWAAIGMFGLFLTATIASAAVQKPNIVVILCDDMGFSDIGCYGGEIQTPTLDKLAAGGLRFTQFYNTARCCPTRASLLTGLYPHQTGIGHMTDSFSPRLNDGYVGDLNNRCLTIAQVLKPAGYGTYAIGKWHVTKSVTPDAPKNNWPLQRGFDHFYGTIVGAGSFYDPGTLTRDNTMITPLNDPQYKPKQFYYTDAIADNACRFAADHHKAHPEEPLFMYVAFTAAHWPMQAPEEEIAKYKGNYSGGYEAIRKARYERSKKLGLIDAGWQLSPQWGDWDKVANKEWEARCMEVYAAMVTRMDEGVGRIVDTLKQNGQLENTLILWLQDNGGCAEVTGRTAPKQPIPPAKPMGPDDLQLEVIPKNARDGRPMRQGVGEMPGPADTYIAYGQGWANVSNTPFREYKHWVHEGGISTPLIASWPAKIKNGGDLQRQPGHLIDIMATCADVGGAAYPRQQEGKEITPLEGRSLLPAFEGKTIERDAIYWEHEGNRAVRMGKWKLVAKSPEGAWELYDMEADRTEMNDLASKQPDRVKEMTAKWEAYAKRADVLPWPWKPGYGEPATGDEKKPGKNGKAAKGKE